MHRVAISCQPAAPAAPLLFHHTPWKIYDFCCCFCKPKELQKLQSTAMSLIMDAMQCNAMPGLSLTMDASKTQSRDGNLHPQIKLPCSIFFTG